jgi:hypothetical protein
MENQNIENQENQKIVVEKILDNPQRIRERLSIPLTGLTPYYLDRLIAIFCENLKRFLNKQELINVVDKTRGY